MSNSVFNVPWKNELLQAAAVHLLTLMVFLGGRAGVGVLSVTGWARTNGTPFPTPHLLKTVLPSGERAAKQHLLLLPPPQPSRGRSQSFMSPISLPA